MTNTNQANAIEGTGQHSHEVPTEIGQVVEIRDGQHDGTAVWLRADGTFVFASFDTGKLEYAQRCVLVIGQDAENMGNDLPWGCDLDAPRGVFLVGVSNDDGLSWVDEGAEVIWDSHAKA